MMNVSQIRQGVITTVRNFYLPGTSLSDEDIARIELGKLPLSRKPDSPGSSPMSGLATAIQSGLGMTIPTLTESWLDEQKNDTVGLLAKRLYKEVLYIELY